MLTVADDSKQDKSGAIHFRTDAETKQLLEDIATASGYSTLQDFMNDLSQQVIDKVDPKVMATVREIQARRRQRVVPKVESPKGRT